MRPDTQPPPANAARFQRPLPEDRPLIEVEPSNIGDAQAALGFALAWALANTNGLILWAAPDHIIHEHGAFCAEGLAHFGARLDRVLFVRAQNQADALWAAEQALSIPGATALCTIAPAPKRLSLTATRRLLLLTEKHQSRCLLTRFDAPSTSAAWLRWSITSAPSEGANHELGAPAFNARLTRNRAGPAGQSWRLIWNAHEHAFTPAQTALDGDLVQPAFDRPAAPEIRRAI